MDPTRPDHPRRGNFSDAGDVLAGAGRDLVEVVARLAAWALLVALGAGTGYLIAGSLGAALGGLAVLVLCFVALVVANVLSVAIGVVQGIGWLMRQVRARRDADRPSR